MLKKPEPELNKKSLFFCRDESVSLICIVNVCLPEDLDMSRPPVRSAVSRTFVRRGARHLTTRNNTQMALR